MATNMLKKLLHISNILGCLTLLFAVSSCSNDNEPDVSYNKQAVTFKITTTDQAVTRSPGEDDLNENRLISVDYYFFADNADASILKLHKTESGFDDVNTHECQLRLKDEELTTLFGELTSGKTCYVYVVANMDEATREAIDGMENTYLNSVKTQSFQTKDISNKKDEDGKLIPQESFVMYGGGTVTLTVDGTKKTITGPDIRVERDAAKIDLFVTKVQNVLLIDAEGNVIKTNDAGEQIDEEGNVVPEADRTPVAEKWTSLPNQMLVMFYNGVNKSYIHSQINDGYHYLPTNDDKNVDNPDRCYFSLTGSNGGARELIKNNKTGNWEHAIPFYSYLSDWRENSGNKDYASYMILVLPWQQVNPKTGDNIGNPRATYYQIQTSTADTYYENRYYQINIQIGILGSFEIPEPVEVTAQYMVVPWGNVDIPGSLREGRYLILETNKYTMNNINSASIPYISSHSIRSVTVENVKYLSLQTFQSTNATHNQNGTWTTYVGNETFTVNADNNLLTLNHTISEDQYTRYNVTVKIVNEAGLEDTADFTIYPAIYADRIDGGDAFINGRFGHVVNPVGGPWRLNDENNNNDPNSYRWVNTTGNAYTIDSYDGQRPNETNNQPRRGNTTAILNSYYGTLIHVTPDRVSTGNALNQRSLTRVTISSFSASYNSYVLNGETYYYKITDPRVKWDTNRDGTLEPYIVTAESRYNNATTNNNQTGNNSPMRYIVTKEWNPYPMVGSGDRTSIAPDIIVSSAFGRTNPYPTYFEQAKKRCATYQEAGYPAGRWRLPTEAELAYMIKLQGEGVIPTLFNTSSQYWASSGRIFRPNANGTATLQNSTYGPCRCVYDVWYWGEPDLENYPANEYHAMPTK